MPPLTARVPDGLDPTSGVEPRALRGPERVRQTVDEHYEFLWRVLRRMGVPEAGIEDAAQQVLVVFANRVDDVLPGAERGFLFGTATRVAADMRKKAVRSPVVSGSPIVELHPDDAPSAEVAIDRRRARETLDRAMDDLPDDLRAVFVLFELEELTMATIAQMLGLPQGTVASRIRRARAEFEASSRRLWKTRSAR
jgi:RNA polymerase sigma-70 factor (ECF subfamily)